MTRVIASAPGRVNLIGEHTDYNGGYVLPTPIPQRTTVELEPRADALVRVWSREIGGAGEYEIGGERREGSWLDYVMGCTHALVTAGHVLRGFDARIASDVPLGSGLSSSAALEVAMLRALREAFALPVDDVQIALLGQRAEHEIVGAPVGVMDQLCASLGTPGAALFIDTRSLEATPVPFSPGFDLLVIASGLRHDHATGGYKQRRAECERAAQLLGVRVLRELDDDARFGSLPPPLDRRVRHVVTENARVLAAVAALRADDREQLGALFRASHASMRDDYEVSLPQIDTLVAIADADPDIYGARLTGGGFGGAIVALAKGGTAAAAGERITARYAAETRCAPQILVAEAACVPS